MRLVTAGVATAGGYLLHPALGVAVGALTLVWVLLGVSAVVSAAANRPDHD